MAIRLRKEGKSLSQIANEITCSKSSISAWVKDYPRVINTSSPPNLKDKEVMIKLAKFKSLDIMKLKRDYKFRAVSRMEDVCVMIKICEDSKKEIEKEYRKEINKIDNLILSLNNQLSNLSKGIKVKENDYNSFSEVLPEDLSRKIEVVFRNGRKSVMVASLVSSYCDNHPCENSPNSPDLWKYV